MNNNGFEIERKFLIAMPEASLLAEAERSEIVQTYLLGEKGTTERVRRRDRSGRIEYTHTVKRRISSLRRMEDEAEISASEYETLLSRADPKRRSVQKERYCFVESGLLWEIDVYPFWTGQAVLEVELTDEAQEIKLPQRIRILREVTDDKRYTNASMSLVIPEEEDMDETKPDAFRLTDERN